MKKSIRKILAKCLALIICSFFVFGSSVPPVATFQVGDVFVAVGSGHVQWWNSAGTVLKGTLNTGLGGFTTGMAFDAAGNLYVTDFSANAVSKFDNTGALLGTFGSGNITPESILFNLAGDAYVGNLSAGIRKYNSAGVYQGTSYSGRVDWMDLGADQCTMYYTVEGSSIASHNVCTNTANAAFVPSVSGSAYALRIRSGGDVLLADGGNIKQFSSAGVQIGTFDAAGEDSWFALNLDPDGTSFWSANFSSANVYRIRISDGAILTSFNTGTGTGTVFGLAVFGEITVGGGGGGRECTCIDCSGTPVVVDQNVTINFNGSNPLNYYSGDPDLQPYFAFDKSGPTPDTWKAIFNMGTHKLTVKNGATITVTNVPNSSNNQAAPGIEINSTCDVLVDTTGHIVVNSLNRNAGSIVMNVKGNVTVNGEVRNEVSGTNGFPGAVTITSRCGNITEGQTGLIAVIGVDPGGNTVTLATCESNCNTGDIVLSGLVKSFAHRWVGASHSPNIRVASVNGKVIVNANTAEPLFDEFQESGTRYDIYGGLLSWTRDNNQPGTVEVQAKDSVVVNGHGSDPTGPVRQSFGAIAAVATSSDAPGGVVHVASLNSSIAGNDRAFDVSGRNRLATNYAHIILAAKKDIKLNRLGGNNSFNPVVDASSPSVGDKGGINDIRAYTGGIVVGTGAIVAANVPPGSGSVQGANNLTSCVLVINNGSVTPADANTLDDAGVCAPPAPSAFITDVCTIIDQGVRNSMINTPEEIVPLKTGLLWAYPNPMGEMATISYSLAAQGKVTIKIFNIAGAEVATLVNEEQTAGQHKAIWKAEGMQQGTYFVHLTAGTYKGVSKLVLVE